MIVRNPTKDTLSVLIKGNQFTVEGESELAHVPEEHALYWKKYLHEFIVLTADKPAVKDEVKVEPAPEPIEVKAEVVPEKPQPKAAKPTKAK